MQSNLQEVLEAIKNGESVVTNVDINLSNANLSDANLSNAILTGANLSDANLRSADLRSADLRSADLSDANLRNADLSGADLSDANLRNADLSDADLRNADVSGADLRGAKNIPHLIAAQLLICPPTGSFQAYKKLREGCIALLEIPEDALRSSATTRKCRASKAKVLKIWDKNGNELSEKSSWYNPNFLYKVGETVYPDSFDENRWDECSNGIHFFMTKEEADDW